MAKFTAKDLPDILEEAYRNYESFRAFASGTAPDTGPMLGSDIIEYAVETEEGSGVYVPVTLSFMDLKLAYEKANLSKRKREAFLLHVIRDMRQEDVAAMMGISTVTVGQYVKSGLLKISEVYFADDKPTRLRKAPGRKRTLTKELSRN